MKTRNTTIIAALTILLASLCGAADKPKELKPEDLTDVKVGAPVSVLTKLKLKPFNKSNRYPFGDGSQNAAYVEKGKIVSIDYEPFIGMTEDDLLRLNSRSWINGHAIDPPQADWKLKEETADGKLYVKEGVNGTKRTRRTLVVTDGKVSRVEH